MVSRAQRRRMRGTVVAEGLERRTLLSGVVVGVTPGSSAAGLDSTPRQLVDDEGGAVMIRQVTPIYPIGPNPATFTGPLARVAAAAPRPAAIGGLNIVLEKGPNLQADSQASAAFDAAAAFVESKFFDPVTVVIDAEVAALGTNVLGLASSVRMGDTFDTIRDLMVADADPDSEAFVAQLPAEAGFFSTLPDLSFSINGAAANRANLLALGMPASQLDYGPDSEYAPGVKMDASITFSSNYPFDYDRSNGISPSLNDFVGVAIHEITHALGFTSAVDEVDGEIGVGGAVAPAPLDMFRFEPGAGGADFAGAARVLSPGSVVPNQVFYDGGIFDPTGISGVGALARGDIPVATGQANGDRQQASHWKDDAVVGRSHSIGIMKPVLTTGTQAQWTAADQRAMGLIGWDTTAPALPATISGTVYQDDNANGTRDAGEAGLSGWTVYQDLNDNGALDTSAGTGESASAVVIPDMSTATSELTVSGVTGVVTDLDLFLTITHSYINDLVATVVSPRGTRVELFRNLDPLFGSENFDNTRFTDEADQRIDDPGAFPPYGEEYRPQNPLFAFDGEDPNGTWKLIVQDNQPGDSGSIDTWSVGFSTAEPSADTDDQGRYEFVDVTPGNYKLRQVVQGGYTQTEPTGGGAHAVVVAQGQQVTNVNFGDTQGPAPAQVVGRHVFYNRSLFDGNDAAANARDDDAIAADKTALLPGDSATVANYTSYSRGINGIMVDVSNLPAGNGLSLSDFQFGFDDGPAPVTAPAPTRFAVRRGAGDNGSDRVTFVWNDGVIRNRWLRVTVSPTANTGLAAPDVFYFGNLQGETGDNPDAAAVNGLDLLGVRRALVAPEAEPGAPLGMDNAFDFNRDGRLNALDMAVVRAAQRRLLPLMTAPVPAAPAAAPARVWDESPAPLLA